MSSALLPANSTPLERHLAEATHRTMPVPIAEMWRPQSCPTHLLPYLAWARSVDRWDPAWSGAAKRGVIASAFYVHQHKGTIGALRRVVEPLGYLIEIVEWWERVPVGPAGTFSLKVGVLDTGISDAMYQELERLIDDAKPLSRHLIGLAISLEARGICPIHVAAYEGDEMAIYPYTPEVVEVAGLVCIQGAEHTIDHLNIYPWSSSL